MQKLDSVASVAFLLLMCAAAFLIGGIPFGYLAGRLVLGDDIRNHGSGNIGATNVGRVLGWRWGGFVLFLDALKGLIPTVGAAYLAGSVLPPEWLNTVAVAAGMSAILGHMYPVYLRFRGGKGVATALGVVIVLSPQATGIAFAVFAVILLITRKMALASMTAAVVFGGTHLFLAGQQAWTLSAAPLTAFAFCVPALIVWRHRTNIVRLLAGTEPAVTERVATQASENTAAGPESPAEAGDA